MVVVKVVVTAIAALEMSGNTQNISNLAYSSVGRAAVSKTACRGFKSFCPCQKEQHRVCGAVLFSCVGGYAEKPIDFPGFVLDEMAVG